MAEQLDTHHKALTLNLDAGIFGAFAEIGAGQEVARWFLLVGGGSATVAKSISAYDKEVSDDLYGVGTRYVSRERLQAMLDHEWTQLLTQLQAIRGATSRFFVFADTVAARNFAGTNEAHGWVGLRFMTEPAGPPNDVVLHVNMMDPSSQLQQEALGVLGVNLLYAAHHQRQTTDGFLAGLADAVAPGRLEIDLVDVRGPAFEGWDRRALLVALIRGGIAEGVVFPTDGQPAPPTEVFHKKTVVLAPGYFETIEPVHERIVAATLSAVGAVTAPGTGPVGFFTIPQENEHTGRPADTDYLLSRVDGLEGLGRGVLLTRRRELHHVSALVNRFTDAPVRFAIGLPTLIRVFHDAHARQLAGSILEAIPRLFAQNAHIYAHPVPASVVDERLRRLSAEGWEYTEVDGWVTADRLRPAPPLSHLYAYLVAVGFIIPMPPPAT
jgi:hypothetical protein